MRIIRSIKIPT